MIVRAAASLLAFVIAACAGSTPVAVDGGDAAEGEPLVVLVPGGAWRTADPAGLFDLAGTLAAAGIRAVTATVRAAEDGVVYPTPIEDVLCAVASAAAELTEDGVEPGPVIVLGHSTGAHLAALAALGFERYRPSCDHPAVSPDALIGIAGVYDVDLVPSIAVDLFGASRDQAAEAWQHGNAQLAAELRPELPVLLLHGDQDDVVPVAFTDRFAAALEAAGHPVTVEIVPGADHHSIYRPETVSALVIGWIEGL